MPINPDYKFIDSSLSDDQKNAVMNFLQQDARKNNMPLGYQDNLRNMQTTMQTMTQQAPAAMPRPVQRPVAPAQAQTFVAPEFPIPQEPPFPEQRTNIIESNLPPEPQQAPTQTRILPPTPDMPAAPEAPEENEALKRTALYRRGLESGFDPSALYVALAQMGASLGNIKGKPTATTVPDFYNTLKKHQQEQSENDLKLQEMELRYKPKVMTPKDQLEMEYRRAQTESVINKAAVDAELNDATSARSHAARKALEGYVRGQGVKGFKADPNQTAADVFKWLPAVQFGMGQIYQGQRATEAQAAQDARQQKQLQATAQRQAQTKPADQFKAMKSASELRKEYQSHPVTKTTREVQTQWGKVKQVLENPSAAGDMAAIFMFMKTLDPGSTVREGEYKSAAEATSALGRVQTYAQNIEKGTKLNPQQRADFKSVMEKFYNAQMKEQAKIDEQFKSLSERSGINPQDLMILEQGQGAGAPTTKVRSIRELMGAK